jgi:hypothetical protein
MGPGTRARQAGTQAGGDGALLDAYAKECEEIRKIEEMKAEIRKLEGSADADRIRSLQAGITEKERWMGKDALEKLWPVQEG